MTHLSRGLDLLQKIKSQKVQRLVIYVAKVLRLIVSLIAFVIFALIMPSLRNGSERRHSIGDFFLYQLLHNVIYMPLAFLSLPVIMYVSRWREYRADYGGGVLAGPQKMISAPNRLERDVKNIQKHDKSIEVMAISSGKGLVELFSSHLPLNKRIQILKNTRFKSDSYSFRHAEILL